MQDIVSSFHSLTSTTESLSDKLGLWIIESCRDSSLLKVLKEFSNPGLPVSQLKMYVVNVRDRSWIT